jgi:hypothetical protein
MPFIKGFSKIEAQLTMTLSELAYIDEQQLPAETVEQQKARMRKDINQALSNSSYPDWQVAWGPGLNPDRSNMMYVAHNQKTQQYAVVIRGTDWSFWLDWLEDFGSLLELVPFSYANDSNIQIAFGTSVGLQQLVEMQGTTPDNRQVQLLTFLEQLPSGTDIFVTGHSLGGCLATVVASWLGYEFGNTSNLKVYTFAAPSAGNDNFATYYNNLFLSDEFTSRAFRIYNSLDAVPNGWATIDTIKTFYQPFPLCTDEIKHLIDTAQLIIENKYSQVGTSANSSTVMLPGHLLFNPPTQLREINPIGDYLFLLEMSWQHSSKNYLNLVNAQSISSETAKFQPTRIGNRVVV